MKKFLLVVALATFLFTARTATAAHKFRLVGNGTPGSLLFIFAEEFAESVNTLSQGELVIEPYAAGVLFPVFETFDNIANGVVDMELLFGLYWTGKDPHFNLLSRPGCPIRTFEEAAYLESKLLDWQNKLYSRFGITHLGAINVNTINEQLLSTVPIDNLEDIKGKKIRSSGFGAKFYGALGASTVSLSAPEVYPAFQTRNIDAGEWTMWEDNMRMGLHEVVSYVLDPALHCGIIEYMPLCVNTKKWEALPQHLKDIVQVAREQALFRASQLYIEEIKAKEKWKALPNIKIVTWNEEDTKKAREVGLGLMLEECNKTDLGKEYLEIYRGVLWELGYKDEAAFLGYKS